MEEVKNKIGEIGVGFKNFRKFKDFPLLEFGNITYMVGRNNAGKSTMVKALLLVKDYINNQFGDTFSFDNDSLNDANIVTFGRAKCNATTDPFIDFNISLSSFNINIRISGEDDRTKANVDHLIIFDSISGIDLTINYTNQEVKLNKTLNTSLEDKNEYILDESIQDTILSLKEQLKNGLDKKSREGIRVVDRLMRLKAITEKLDLPETEEQEFETTYPLRSIEGVGTEENGLLEVVSDFLDLNHREYRNMIDTENDFQFNNEQDEELFKTRFEKVKALYNESNSIKDVFQNLINSFRKEQLYYLGANPSKQTALFPLRDKDNSLAQAIHEFHQHNIEPGHEEWLFVKKWMKEFEVGDDFEIKFYAGEAYEFYIIKGDRKSHLSDKGMGSLQAMMLILRVASLIRVNKKLNQNITLIVEEPELNLHPALQSRLTDFFHYVNEKYNFNFIIETHSEYMIRKTQVIVNKEEYGEQESINPNPFKVYYYPMDTPVYEMNFRADGKFTNEFHQGFFDVSTDLVFDII